MQYDKPVMEVIYIEANNVVLTSELEINPGFDIDDKDDFGNL